MTELFFDPPDNDIACGILGIVMLMCLVAGSAVLLSERIRKHQDDNLRKRYVSACVLAVIVVACTYSGGIPFALLVGVTSLGCIGEFLHLVHAEETIAYKWIGWISAMAFAVAAFWESSSCLAHLQFSGPFQSLYGGNVNASNSLHPFYILPVAIIMMILVVPLALKRYKGMSARESFTIFGVLYFGWFLAHLIFIRNSADGFGLAMFLCMTVVWNDVIAYAAGRLFGKTKMAPLISPKKTREGAIGGFLGSLAAALLFRYLIPDLSLLTSLCFGTLVGLCAPAGDLIVSVVKRDVGTKESGSFIPGHGGLLDRCGSLVFASPAFYYGMRFGGFLN